MKKQKDSRKPAPRPVNGETLRDAVLWATNDKIFANIRFHGNTSWHVVDLVLLAVVWVWSGDSKLTEAFVESHRWSMQVLGRAAVSTYQGMLKALVTWTKVLLPLMLEQMHLLMERHAGKHWRVGIWMALAVDGSRVSTPRTRGNEDAFAAPNFGKSSTAKYRRKKRRAQGIRRRSNKKAQPAKPQIWVTLLWHMGLHMPWSWKLGPSYSSEREHFRGMVQDQRFPENTVFCGDAGFVGYDLWKGIIDAGHSFLIRVGGNVRLLKKLGYVREKNGIVYCWPDHAARAKQPPLVLRLFRLQVGRRQMWLVSNVLDDKKLSDREATQLYKLRWGVELQFRSVKQTFGRAKLRSRHPDRAQVELEWSLFGLALIQLFAVKEQIAIGEVPELCSVSLAIGVIREMLQRWSEEADESFAKKLRQARKDTYERKRPKAARYRPDSKDKPAAGKPTILNATRKQKNLLQECLQYAA